MKTNSASSTTCYAGTHAVCDPPIKCNGMIATCPQGPNTNGMECGAADGGECDLPEVCMGRACPTGDKVKANNVPCGPAPSGAQQCANRANCDGVNPTCPGLSAKPSNSKCRTATSICKEDTNCDGSSLACPAAEPNSLNSKECRASAGVCKTGVFLCVVSCCDSLLFVGDNAEQCNNGVCPPDSFKSSSSIEIYCRFVRTLTHRAIKHEISSAMCRPQAANAECDVPGIQLWERFFLSRC
jgi:hypothetical protein